jgi:hypothetical protein
MPNSKYLIFRESLEVSRLIPFLFSDPLRHIEIANFMQKTYPKTVLLSGGVCTVDLDSSEVLCYTDTGGSMPGLRTGKDDPDILKRAFCEWDAEKPGGNF